MNNVIAKSTTIGNIRLGRNFEKLEVLNSDPDIASNILVPVIAEIIFIATIYAKDHSTNDKKEGIIK